MASPPPGLWLGREPLLLASRSRVRRSLLDAAGIPVDAVAADLDERALEAALGPDATPADVALHLARAKAKAVAARHPGRVVIGADQVLELEGRGWPKPSTPAEARAQIGRLAARTHLLRSGYVILSDGEAAGEGVETARLTMRPLTDGAVAAYVAAAGEAATRSAGGYEVEGLGIHLFAAVEGEHSTILGLPMLPVLAALRGLGFLAI